MGEGYTADEVDLEQLEIEALDGLCQRFNSGASRDVTQGSFRIRPLHSDATLLWLRLISLGAIKQVESKSQVRFAIDPNIVAITDRRKAEIKARRKPPDRVAAAERWMRSHWLLSGGVIVLLVFYFLTGLLINVADLIDWCARNGGK